MTQEPKRKFGSYAMRATMLIVVLGILVLYTQSWVAERRLLAAVIGKPAPDFTLTSLDGKSVKLSDFRGKPVVLAFWAVG